MIQKEGRQIFASSLLSGGWGSMLLSIALYLLFWRVDNEPGARPVPGLFWAAIMFCSLGGSGFLGGHIYLITKKAWLMLGLSWAACLALLIGAIFISPVMLLLLV